MDTMTPDPLAVPWLAAGSVHDVAQVADRFGLPVIPAALAPDLAIGRGLVHRPGCPDAIGTGPPPRAWCSRCRVRDVGPLAPWAGFLSQLLEACQNTLQIAGVARRVRTRPDVLPVGLVHHVGTMGSWRARDLRRAWNCLSTPAMVSLTPDEAAAARAALETVLDTRPLAGRSPDGLDELVVLAGLPTPATAADEWRSWVQARPIGPNRRGLAARAAPAHAARFEARLRRALTRVGSARAVFAHVGTTTTRAKDAAVVWQASAAPHVICDGIALVVLEGPFATAPGPGLVRLGTPTAAELTLLHARQVPPAWRLASTFAREHPSDADGEQEWLSIARHLTT